MNSNNILSSSYPFLFNKYSKWYFNLIKKAKNRDSIKGDVIYYEQHHIYPRSFSIINNTNVNNDSNNLILLTAREHYICHLLLTKATSLKYREKMVHAFWAMNNQKQEIKKLRKTKNRIYEYSRIEHARILSSKENIHAKNKAFFKNDFGDSIYTYVYDERVISGEYFGMNKNKKITDSHKDAISKTNIGMRVMINDKTKERKNIILNKQEDYLSNGWRYALKSELSTKESRNLVSVTHKNKKYMINDITKEKKLVLKKDQNSMIKLGWRYCQKGEAINEKDFDNRSTRQIGKRKMISPFGEIKIALLKNQESLIKEGWLYVPIKNFLTEDQKEKKRERYKTKRLNKISS